jgi:hypothetical protein
MMMTVGPMQPCRWHRNVDIGKQLITIAISLSLSHTHTHTENQQTNIQSPDRCRLLHHNACLPDRLKLDLRSSQSVIVATYHDFVEFVSIRIWNGKINKAMQQLLQQQQLLLRMKNRLEILYVFFIESPESTTVSRCHGDIHPLVIF